MRVRDRSLTIISAALLLACALLPAGPAVATPGNCLEEAASLLREQEEAVGRELLPTERRYLDAMRELVSAGQGEIESGLFVRKPGVLLLTDAGVAPGGPDTSVSFLIAGTSLESSLEFLSHGGEIARLTSSNTKAMDLPMFRVQGDEGFRKAQIEHLKQAIRAQDDFRRKAGASDREICNMASPGCKSTALVLTLPLKKLHHVFFGRIPEAGNEREVREVFREMARQLHEAYPGQILAPEKYAEVGVRGRSAPSLLPAPPPVTSPESAAAIQDRVSREGGEAAGGVIVRPSARVTSDTRISGKAKALFAKLNISSDQSEAEQLAEFRSRLTYLAFKGKGGAPDGYLEKVVGDGHVSILAGSEVGLEITGVPRAQAEFLQRKYGAKAEPLALALPGRSPAHREEAAYSVGLRLNGRQLSRLYADLRAQPVLAGSEFGWAKAMSAALRGRMPGFLDAIQGTRREAVARPREGVFFGTFDPITPAHEDMIHRSLTELGMKKVYVVVNRYSPEGARADPKFYYQSAEERASAVRAAVARHGDRVEVIVPDQSSAETRAALASKSPDGLCLIGGEDTLENMSRVLAEPHGRKFKPVLFGRQGKLDPASLPADWQHVPFKEMSEVSSTAVRSGKDPSLEKPDVRRVAAIWGEVRAQAERLGIPASASALEDVPVATRAHTDAGLLEYLAFMAAQRAGWKTGTMDLVLSRIRAKRAEPPSAEELKSRFESELEASEKWRGGKKRRAYWLLPDDSSELERIRGIFGDHGIEILTPPRDRDWPASPEVLERMLSAKAEDLEILGVIDASRGSGGGIRLHLRGPDGVETSAVAPKASGGAARSTSLAQAMGAFVASRHAYAKLRTQRNQSVEKRRPIEFDSTLKDYVTANPVLGAPRFRASPLWNIVETASNGGAFVKAPANRRQGNYFLPGGNSGIPLVERADPFHEATFFLHDVVHEVIPDPIVDTSASELDRRVYVTWRMLAESAAQVVTDGLAGNSLRAAVPGTKMKPRTLSRIVEPLASQAEDPGRASETVRRAVEANGQFWVANSPRALHDLSPAAPPLLAQFRSNYEGIFLSDLEWNNGNFGQLKARQDEISDWIAHAKPLLDAYGLRRPLLSELKARLSEEAKSSREAMVRELTAIMHQDHLGNGLLPQSPVGPGVAESRAFVRFMAGQLLIFSKHKDLPEAAATRARIIAMIQAHKPLVPAEAMSAIRSEYERFLKALHDLGRITADDVLTYRDGYPFYGPHYVSYKGPKAQTLEEGLSNLFPPKTMEPPTQKPAAAPPARDPFAHLRSELTGFFQRNANQLTEENSGQVDSLLSKPRAIELIESILASPEKLREVARKSYVHSLGFLKIPILDEAKKGDYSVRLHLWLPESQSQGVPVAEGRHEHRWDFVSRVLTGALENHRYAVSEAKPEQTALLERLTRRLKELPSAEREAQLERLDLLELLEETPVQTEMVRLLGGAEAIRERAEPAKLAATLGLSAAELLEVSKLYAKWTNRLDRETQMERYELMGVRRLDRIAVQKLPAGSLYFHPIEQAHRLFSDPNEASATLILLGPANPRRPGAFYRETELEGAKSAQSRARLEPEALRKYLEKMLNVLKTGP